MTGSDLHSPHPVRQQTPADRPSAQLIGTVSILAVFVSLTGLTGLVVSVWLRSGLEQPTALYALAILALTASASSPVTLLQSGLLCNARLLGLSCLPALLLLPFGLFVPYWILVSILAVIAFTGLSSAVRSIRFTAPGVASTVICGVILGLYIVLHYNSHRYLPILAQELASVDAANRDDFFHAALANMTVLAGFPSTGVDGVKPLFYHFGVHYLLAGVVKVTGVSPFLAYPILAQVLLAPLTFFGLGLAVIAVLARLSTRPLLTAAIVSISGLIVFDYYGVNSFGSPSTLLGMAVFFLFFPVLYSMIEGRHPTTSEILVALTLPLLLALVKGPVAAMWLISVLYVMIRRSPLSIGMQFGVLACLGVAFVAACFMIRYGFHAERQTAAFFYLARYDPFPMFVIPVSVPLAYVVLSLIQSRVFSLGKLWAHIVDARLLLVEVALVLVTVSLIVIGTGAMPRSTPYWFVIIPAWLAWPAIVIAFARGAAAAAAGAAPPGSRFGDGAPLVPQLRPRRRLLAARPAALALGVAAAFAAVGFVGALAGPGGLMDPFYRQVAVLLSHADLPIPRRRSFDRHVLATGGILPREIEGVTTGSEGHKVIEEIRRFTADGASGIAVYAPPDNERFWSVAKVCETKPLFVPAVAGVPMLLGLPPKRLSECLPRMAWYYHRKTYGDAHTRPLSRDELCAHAQRRNFHTVIALGKDRTELVSCAAAISGQASNAAR